MKARVWKLTVALVTATMLIATRANASSVTFHLDQGATGPLGDGGTVTIDDTLSGPNTVNVLVTLNPGYDFVKTGAGDALAFNLLGDPAIGIGSITSGFAIGPAPVNESPFGTFNYSVSCTTGCGNGGSNPNPGPLSFDVLLTGITLDQFVGNTKGYYFASDLIGPGREGRITGNMAALGPQNTTQIDPVPEPASLTLFGTGLMFAARRLRRRIA